MSQLCPCCSNLDFITCCEPFLLGEKKPQTPEKLMRSRYAAFVMKDVSYLVRTHLSDDSPTHRESEIKEMMKDIVWEELKILDANGSDQDTEGFIEFKAYFIEGELPYVLHEKSKFEKVKGEWLYVSGEYL